MRKFFSKSKSRLFGRLSLLIWLSYAQSACSLGLPNLYHLTTHKSHKNRTLICCECACRQKFWTSKITGLFSTIFIKKLYLWLPNLDHLTTHKSHKNRTLICHKCACRKKFWTSKITEFFSTIFIKIYLSFLINLRYCC